MSTPTSEQLDFARRLAAGGSLWFMDAAHHVAFDAKTPMSSSQPLADDMTAGVVHLGGELTRAGSLYGTSLDAARQSLGNLTADAAVDVILLHISSPGGTVSGTKDVADAVLQARRQKPVVAFIEDLGASAAYWIASSADYVVANQPTALIGSIGTALVVLDAAKMMDRVGIEVVAISTGSRKTAGLFGTSISDEHREYLQELVEGTQAHFTAAVEQNRGIRIDGRLADGGVFLAEEALQLGLIDAIQPLEQTLKQLSTKGIPMRNSQAATLAELKAALPDADNDFLVSQLEAEASVDGAKDAWIEHQANEIARLKIKPACGKPVETRNEFGSGSGGSEFSDLVTEKMKAGMDRPAAVAAVVREEPEAYAEFLEANNPGGDVSHLIRR